MEQENKNVTWEEVEKEITERMKKPTSEHLAMEVLKKEQEKSNAKDRGVIGLTVALIVITLGMAIINYKNDCDWRKLFGEYDYITQDGGGYNNVNSGQQGDVNNGATGENEEK